MNATSPRLHVPFDKLLLSQDCQARPEGGKPRLSIPELAASIRVNGVLQNLVVIKAARGMFEVCAGGRRLESLALLVAAADIHDNYPVPMLVVRADKDLIASLPAVEPPPRRTAPAAVPGRDRVRPRSGGQVPHREGL